VRLGQLTGKEIINVTDGQRLGRLGDCDLAVDPASGAVKALVVPPPGRRRDKGAWWIPWSAIRRIGPELLLVELEIDGLPPRAGMP
jgi:YlmC/YmxH family sporulation protein